MTCPYLTCRGERAHPGPHLLEAADVERAYREGAHAERRRLRKAVASLARVSRKAVSALLEEPA